MTTAIVLAGGLGTRLRSAVPDRPKPMATVGDRPFLEHLLDYWSTQGIERFVLSVGYRHEIIVAHFGAAYRGIPVEYAVEAQPLGTGGALLLAVRHLGDDPFLLLNGDTYFPVDLAIFASFARARRADWCLALFRTNEVGRYGAVTIGEEGRIAMPSPQPPAVPHLANGGVYFIDPAALPRDDAVAIAPVSLEHDLLPAAGKLRKRLYGLEFDDAFLDIGVPDDYHRAAAVIAACRREGPPPSRSR